MNFRQFIAYKVRCLIHGKQQEDWYRRQLEANDFDRECADDARRSR